MNRLFLQDGGLQELPTYSHPSFARVQLQDNNVLVASSEAADACLIAHPSKEVLISSVHAIRTQASALFVIAYHPDATEDAFLREQAFSAGANMVTRYLPHVHEALNRVAAQQLQGNIECPWCGLPGLKPAGYHLHQPLYHIYHRNIDGCCQVCRKATSNLARHLHHSHPPSGHPHEDRTGVFALVVVRRPSDGRFLLVQEFACQGYWLPGGGVNAGETLQDGAKRECLEEAGVLVQLKGLLCVEVLGSWHRVIFYAEPAVQPCHDGSTMTNDKSNTKEREVEVSSMGWPKTVPDFESAGACYVDAGQVESLPLRSTSEMNWVDHVASGGSILPLQLPPQHAASFAGWSF